MGEPTNIRDAYNWNISRIAEAFGFSRDTVRKRLRDAFVEPVSRRANQPLYSLADVGPALYGNIGLESPDIPPEDLPPKDRKDWYQSENERVKLEKELRHLVADDEVAREYSVLAKALANGLDSLPDKLERECSLEGPILEKIQDVIDGIRENIYAEASE